MDANLWDFETGELSTTRDGCGAGYRHHVHNRRSVNETPRTYTPLAIRHGCIVHGNVMTAEWRLLSRHLMFLREQTASSGRNCSENQERMPFAV
jgi:hypothetical protein